MGVHAGPQEILAAADLGDDGDLWWLDYTHPGLGGGAVHLYSFLIGS